MFAALADEAYASAARSGARAAPPAGSCHSSSGKGSALAASSASSTPRASEAKTALDPLVSDALYAWYAACGELPPADVERAVKGAGDGPDNDADVASVALLDLFISRAVHGRVRLHGLQKRADLNAKTGVIMGAKRGERYPVRVGAETILLLSLIHI